MSDFLVAFGPEAREEAALFVAGRAVLGAATERLAFPGDAPDGPTSSLAVALRPRVGVSGAADPSALAVVVGRLEDRAGLAIELGLPPAASPAELVLASWLRWGDAAAGRLEGAYAAVVVDRRRQRLTAWRDRLGNRTIYFRRVGETIYLAGSEAPLLAGPAAGADRDERTLLAFLALEPPAPGATFFRGLEELEPGHLLIAHRGSVEVRPLPPAETPDPLPGSDAEWVAAFREALVTAVGDALDGAGTPGVMMSGGLDSGSVAAVAASSPALAGRPLHSFSWVFDQLSSCDERPWIDLLVTALGLHHHPLAADDLGPLAEPLAWPWNPGRPHGNPFRLAKQRLYHRAAAAGVEILLTGAAGDLLFSAPHAWLRELLRAGRPLSAAARAGGELLRGRPRALAKAGYTAITGHGPPPRRTPARWLNAEARRLPAASPDHGSRSPHRARRQAVTGSGTALGVATEAAWAASVGVDLRDPYRHSRLVALALAAPAHLGYRHGRHKDLLRRAVEGVLPEPVRLRTQRTTLEPLFERGWEQGRALRETLLSRPEALWRRWVDPRWLARVVAAPKEALDPMEAVALWRCLALELWHHGWECGNSSGWFAVHPMAEGAAMNDDRRQSPLGLIEEKVRATGGTTATGTTGRRAYRPPALVSLGDVRGLTFGGSPGIGDSGSEFIQEPPV